MHNVTALKYSGRFLFVVGTRSGLPLKKLCQSAQLNAVVSPKVIRPIRVSPCVDAYRDARHATPLFKEIAGQARNDAATKSLRDFVETWHAASIVRRLKPTVNKVSSLQDYSPLAVPLQVVNFSCLNNAPYTFGKFL